MAEDLQIDLSEGAGFVSSSSEGPTALVLVGSGRVRFSPPIGCEQRQLALFSGSPVLSERFEAAYLRFSPVDFVSLVAAPAFHSEDAPPEWRRRATAIFDEYVGRSFALDSARSGQPRLSTVPPPGDLLVELQTTRLGRLAYARVARDPEDILLLDRDRGHTIASYPSRAHGSATGLEYGDEQGLGYEALSYDVAVDIVPSTRRLSGRARVSLKALEPLETVSLRLDRGLSVAEVRSAAPHQFLQQEASDTLQVRILPPLAAGRQIALDISYSGSVEPQELSRAIDRRREGIPRSPRPHLPGEEQILLYGSRVFFFPQSPVRNHVPVTLHVGLPEGYTAVASGVPDLSAERAGRPTFAFRTQQPIRYLSLIVGRLQRVPSPVGAAPVPIRVFATSGLADRGRALAPQVADILRFYATLAGPDPFSHLTVVVVETPAPAGHGAAYLSVLGEPPGWNPARAADDPAYLGGEPLFFVAHEIAHQWWGQAVGWRNYREQWLSEGLAQYFASLYVRRLRGEEASRRVLEWMGHWARGVAGQGPISLGVRVGEINGCPTCFAAALYDRGALFLQMLRRLLGDESFLGGLCLYLDRWKFRRAGTGDLERAFEEVSGRDLSDFFDQWIRDDGLPRLEWSAEADTFEGGPGVLLRVHQIGKTWELPLSVTIESGDKVARTEVVRVFRPVQEFRFPLAGRLRRVLLNADQATLCDLREVAPPKGN
ncbi:MAG TPA: M1 family aminopeptidase [Thermoanaerobaculia bacterium]|nr:M1 family aminopeptidase [Thermoanaerobaculia bacterium]